jgi:DNA-directed RNA polymerase beta subunit
MGDFPLMTERGTFIINGTERVVVSQLVRSPGVYFEQTPDKTSDKDIYTVKIIPSRGAWLEFEIDKRDMVGVRVDRKRKQSSTSTTSPTAASARVGELIQNQVRIGLSRMERVVRERMTTQDVEAITPQTLINIRPVVAAIKEFFGTSQLSQFMDQNNPLSGLTHRAACRRWARVVSPVSAPASRSATCTSATTAACARSRPLKARTSA